MDLNIDQQIFAQIKKSHKVLVALPHVVNPDQVATALALRLFLLKLQKEVVVACSGELPENLKFLPGYNFIQHQIKAPKSLVVTVDTSVKKLEEISYETEGQKVHIYLKAQNQEFSPEDLTFTKEKFPVDLVMGIGAKSLEDFGKLLEQAADLFFETAKVNIDNNPANEYYGSMNLVGVTATSVAEILAELLQSYEEQLIDEDMATCLLAGIIERTSSFQDVHTTPKAFIKASELVSLGARQQEIVKNIYKTKSLPLLRLWGRALARMKIQEDQKIIYSVLNPSDFDRASATEHDVPPVLKEFLDNVSGYNIVGLIVEPLAGSSRLLVAVHEQFPLDNFLQALGSEAKIADFFHGNYKIVEQGLSGVTSESLENRFLDAVKSGLTLS